MWFRAGNILRPFEASKGPKMLVAPGNHPVSGNSSLSLWNLNSLGCTSLRHKFH